jgi:GTPase
MKTLAIIGRPNVGKSTLFNRLAGKRKAIVHDQPGVTRDRKHGEGSIGPLSFGIIDTPGLEDIDENSLQGRMYQQSLAALKEADVALMVIDAIEGVTPRDEFFAKIIRRLKIPIVLVANKAESKHAQSGVLDAYRLGMGEPIAISAEHGEGMLDLYERLSPLLEDNTASTESILAEEEDDGSFDEHEELDLTKPVKICIVGRPNVGKSTLMNCILGEERVLTGPEAGITRDAITVPFTYQGRNLQLIDTAGIRRKSRVHEKLEQMSVSDSTYSLRFAQVVVLVLDATQALDKQDNSLAAMVEREGRACVIALNKWDLIEDKQALLDELHDRLKDVMPQMRGITVVPISALQGKNTDRLLQACLKTYERWNFRVSTGALNRWLEETISRHTPPLIGGRRFKIRYITQAKTRPPTFILFVNLSEGPESYLRYLVNNLRERFELPGVPLRLLLRTSKNPYENKD